MPPKHNAPLSTAINLSAASNDGAPASPEHKRFQTLLGKIDKARARLQAWQEQLPLFAQDYTAKVKPEVQALCDLRCAWATDIDQALLTRRWSKAETASLTQELLETCQSLFAELEGERLAELKALYNRHADQDFDAAEKEQVVAMKAALESAHGFDFGDDPIDTLDDLIDRARDLSAQQQAQQRAQHQSDDEDAPNGRFDANGPDLPGAEPQRGRAKPKHRANAAQKRAELEAQEVSLTVREVFRKLAAALHPDRTALGASDEQRAKRTELMQRANSAYAGGDLLALLTLQLEIEQVSQAQAAHMAASQLKHFNKLLAEQLRELEQEIDGRQYAFQSSYNLGPLRRLDPAQLKLVLKDELRSLEGARAQLERQRRCLRAEGPTVKRFLKDLRQEQRFSDAFDDLFGDLPF
jgi:hypothetical protein